MRYYLSTAAFCAIAGFAHAAKTDTTEFLLIPLEQDMDGDSQAVVIEPPHAVIFNTGDCGTLFTVVGDGVDGHDSPADHYGGVAYSGELKVHGSETISGFVMSHKMQAGTRLSKFELLDGGQSCSERVNGKVHTFRKYSAVLH
jgi:hypothetical protein